LSPIVGGIIITFSNKKDRDKMIDLGVLRSTPKLYWKLTNYERGEPVGSAPNNENDCG